jgi:uncharacterized protein (TIGR04141 family)
MKDKPINKITIYLLKGRQKFKEYLKNPEKLTEEQRDNNTVLYYGNSQKYQPKWLDKFFGSFLFQIKDKIYSATASAILFKMISYKNEKYVFAIPFGLGWRLLKDGCWEERFGLITTLNLVDDSTIRSIDKDNMGVSPKQSREQIISKGDVMDFGIDIEQDLLKSVTGKCSDENIGTTITGKDSLHISSKTNFDNLDDLLRNVIENYQSEKYKENFGWIDNISALTDKTKIEQLDNLLIEKISNNPNLQNIWLAIPEIIDWSGVAGFRYVGNRKNVFDDLDIINLLEHFEGKKIQLSIEELRKQKVETVDSDGNAAGNSWNAYNCIYAEIENENKQYVLNNNKWFMIDRDFKLAVENEYRLILNPESLPEYQSPEKEDAYNERFAKEKSFTLMDKKNIAYGGGSNKIEFCDIYDFDSKKLYHIKRYGNSSALSHLFNQGLVSAELMLQDEDFRKKVNVKLPDAQKFVPVENRPNASDYTIVFGVISKSGSDLEIPFFSKVTLKNIKRTLSGFGIGKISLVRIKHKKGLSTDEDNHK